MPKKNPVLFQKPRKFAVFDIDGTIFRSSLLIELVDALVQEGVFPKKATSIYERAKTNWLDRKGNYDAYIEAVVRAFMQHMRGISEHDFFRIARHVIAVHKHRIYRYTRDLVVRLKAQDYYLLAISNSPKDVLDFFCAEYGFDKVYGRMYEIDARGRFTGKILNFDLVRDKSRLLKRAALKENLTFSKSIGVGDSEADIPILKLVDHAICFNPNRVLWRAAKKYGWEVIVERKDMIYHL